MRLTGHSFSLARAIRVRKLARAGMPLGEIADLVGLSDNAVFKLATGAGPQPTQRKLREIAHGTKLPAKAL